VNAIYKLVATAVLALSSAAFAAYAQTEQQSDMATGHTGQTSHSAADMSEGEVRKVDKEAGKLTIKHGPLKNLDMPAMTMVFKAMDPVMLDQVKAGDKVSFVADNINGQITVTQLEVVQ
jgi:Cu(I)/Ag(I) efflux system protein CusF